MVGVVDEHLEADRPAGPQRVDELVGEQRGHLVEQATRAHAAARPAGVISLNARRTSGRRAAPGRRSAPPPARPTSAARARWPARSWSSQASVSAVQAPGSASAGCCAPEGVVGLAVGEGHLEAGQRGPEHAGEHVVGVDAAGSGRGDAAVDEHDVRPAGGVCRWRRWWRRTRPSSARSSTARLEPEVVEHRNEVIGVGTHAERGGSLAERPRPRRSGATSDTSDPRARATPCHERWLPVMPWAATTTLSPVAPAPDVQRPAGDGHVEDRVRAPAPSTGDATAVCRGRRQAMTPSARRAASAASSRPSSAASTASVCSPSHGTRVSGPSATFGDLDRVAGDEDRLGRRRRCGAPRRACRGRRRAGRATTSSSRKHGPGGDPGRGHRRAGLERASCRPPSASTAGRITSSRWSTQPWRSAKRGSVGQLGLDRPARPAWRTAAPGRPGR